MVPSHLAYIISTYPSTLNSHYIYRDWRTLYVNPPTNLCLQYKHTSLTQACQHLIIKNPPPPPQNMLSK